MEAAVDAGKDLQNKNSAKKKKPVEDKAANHRKISDFFKTPEKSIGHKQKSLLQFFGKGPLEKPANSGEIIVNDISPLANSDKENADILVDIEKEPVINNKSKKSKHKDKKAGVETKSKKLRTNSKSESNEDDSIILLSDSICSVPAIFNDDDTANASRGELKILPDEKVDITCDSGTVTVTIDKNTNKDKEEEKAASKSKNRIRRKSRSVPKEDFLLKIGNEHIKKKEPKTVSKNETAVKDQASDNQQVNANEKEVKQKKCALKVEDMMNLLKEVQEDTVSVSKKKKHRKKHKHSHKSKHKGTALKETHEISCANPSDSNEEKHTEAGNKKSENKIVSGDCKDEYSDIVQKKKNKDITKRSEKNKELTLSYTKFTQNLEQNKEDKKSLAINPKEMSYTEYLEHVEKSRTENDDNEDAEMEIEQVEGNEDKIQVNDAVEVEVTEKDKCTEVLKETNKNNFFTLMTSTPDHKTKTKKNETKNKIIKVRNGKIENDESVIIVDVDNKCEKDKTEKNEQTANRTEINKQLFAVRKTQSTLSFGKTGLACSKPEKPPKDLNTDEIVSDTVPKKNKSKLEAKQKG